MGRLLDAVENLEAKVAALPKWTVYALVLALGALDAASRPALKKLGAEDLGGGRYGILLGGERSDHRRAVARLRKNPNKADGGDLRVLTFRPIASQSVLAAVSGQPREVYVVSPRGEGKTYAGLASLLLYAVRHQREGGTPPVRVMAFSDTFASQRIKLLRSAMAPEWGGLWRTRDDGHVLEAVVDGQVLVSCDVFGVEDMGAVDRLRMEAHACWLEEPAPAAVGETSSGVSEDALGVAYSSLRLPSYAHPMLVTSNYPDENHWSWRRYVSHPLPGVVAFRIPPCERATPEQRAAMTEALASRPDLKRRLLDGEPGLVVAGIGVCDRAWNPDLHVSREVLRPVHGARLYFGHDAGLTPVTVVLQLHEGQLQVLAGLASTRAGTEQHLTSLVVPWLARHAPWWLKDGYPREHWVDPSMKTPSQSNLSESPEAVIRRDLRGLIRDGEVSWPGRRDPLLAMLGRLVNGRPALVVSAGPDTELLRQALSGRWHYPRARSGEVLREFPEKDHPWSDLGDALAYPVAGIAPWRVRDGDAARTHPRVNSSVSLYDYDRPPGSPGYRPRPSQRGGGSGGGMYDVQTGRWLPG